MFAYTPHPHREMFFVSPPLSLKTSTADHNTRSYGRKSNRPSARHLIDMSRNFLPWVSKGGEIENCSNHLPHQFLAKKIRNIFVR